MANSDGCKHSCCWVPFDGVCAKQWTCACHAPAHRETKTPSFADLEKRLKEQFDA